MPPPGRARPRLPAALALSVLSGVALSFSHPPVDIGPLAFVAMAPFLWVLRTASPRRALGLGFAFGFAYFGSLLYWVLLFGKLGWGALSLVSSAFPALFALVAVRVWREDHRVRSSVGLAAAWTATEYLRGMWPLGGFTWGGVGYSQAGDGFLMPLASITGVWGVTFVVVLVDAFVLLALEHLSARRLAAAGGVVGVSLAAVLLPGLTPIHAADGRALDVAVVQGNDIDTRLQDRIRIGLIARKHASLHETLAGDPPDLAVWPEDAVDTDPQLDPQLGALVSGAIRDVGAPTLVGAITGPDGGRLYNQSLLYDGTGRIVGRYTKVHLVPFGEYVPWRKELDFISALRQIPRDLTPGRHATLLSLGGIPFANVICYENSFPSLDRRLVNRGAEFVVVSTNNASYLHTAASRQHLVMSRFRAVENGRWVVHAAVSGISAFIDPHGHVYQRTELFQRVIDRDTIRLSSARTIYTRFGDWFPWASLLLAGGLVLIPRRREREGRMVPPLPSDVRALVILPTYNERGTIEQVVSRVLAVDPRVEVLVVDDGSPDGTGAVVKAMAAGEPRLRLVERGEKRGLADAYGVGFRWGLEEGYDLVVEMDADLSHQPEELPGLLHGAEGLDLTIGSRYVPGGSVTNWGVLRRGLSRGGNTYARVLLGFPVSDSTSGFRVFRTGLLRHLLGERVRADGYGFQIELAYRAWRDGFAVGEVPISFREREHGHSKISRGIVFEALWLVTVWAIRDRLLHRRRVPS